METKYIIRRLIFGIPLAYVIYKLVYILWLATAIVLGEIH